MPIEALRKFDQSDVCYFAATNFRGQNRKFGIKVDDRRRHMYFIGKTGMGKSTTMENMIIQDIADGRGVGVMDPHGDLAEKILDHIPSHRINDVVYFNPADIEYPIAFNILENVDPNYKHLVASGLMGVFTKIWANVWSARMEYIMNNCILALLDSPGNTLLGVNRLLVDKDYRRQIVTRITDPVVRSFWVNEYANYNDKFRVEAIAPIQNKVGQFLSTAIIRNIVGQTKSTIDMREIMDSGKVLIMNLSKGRIGEDSSALLGAMMVTKLQLAAMSRVDTPEAERKDFFLYVDEFQNFATEAFTDILSEARKYRLSLILAHQYIEQLDEKVAAAVFGNVGTIACFRVGAADAEELVKEFSPYFTEEDLVNLTKFDIYLRLMIDGVASRPFSASSLPPLSTQQLTGSREKVIAVSRERYSRPRMEVEEKILRWTGVEEIGRAAGEEAGQTLDEEAVRYSDAGIRQLSQRSVGAENLLPLPSVTPQGPRSNRNNAQAGDNELKISHPKEATCDNCGKGTLVIFAPDEKRNVFCKRCLKLFKKGLIDPKTLPKRNVKERYDDLPSLTPREQSKATVPVREDLISSYRNFSPEIPTALVPSGKVLDSVRHDQDTTPHYPSESAARRELVPTEGRPNWSPNLLSALTTTAPARIPVPGNVRPTTSPISPIPFTPSRKNKGKKKNIQLQPSWPPVQNHPSRVSSPSQPPPIPVEILTPEPISLMEAISRKPVNFRAIRPDRLASLALSSSGQHYPSESAGSYRKSSLSESSTLPEGHSAVGISSTEIPIRETRPVPKLPPTPSVTPAPAPITAAATPEPSTRHHPIRGVTPGTVVHLP